METTGAWGDSARKFTEKFINALPPPITLQSEPDVKLWRARALGRTKEGVSAAVHRHNSRLVNKYLIMARASQRPAVAA